MAIEIIGIDFAYNDKLPFPPHYYKLQIINIRAVLLSHEDAKKISEVWVIFI